MFSCLLLSCLSSSSSSSLLPFNSLTFLTSFSGHPGASFQLEIPKPAFDTDTVEKGSLLSPMPGRIVKVFSKPGDKITKGTPLLILEAMKMEHTIKAPHDGTIGKINYKVGDLVEEKKVLATIEA